MDFSQLMAYMGAAQSGAGGFQQGKALEKIKALARYPGMYKSFCKDYIYFLFGIDDCLFSSEQIKDLQLKTFKLNLQAHIKDTKGKFIDETLCKGIYDAFLKVDFTKLANQDASVLSQLPLNITYFFETQLDKDEQKDFWVMLRKLHDKHLFIQMCGPHVHTIEKNVRGCAQGLVDTGMQPEQMMTMVPQIMMGIMSYDEALRILNVPRDIRNLVKRFDDARQEAMEHLNDDGKIELTDEETEKKMDEVCKMFGGRQVLENAIVCISRMMVNPQPTSYASQVHKMLDTGSMFIPKQYMEMLVEFIHDEENFTYEFEDPHVKQAFNDFVKIVRERFAPVSLATESAPTPNDGNKSTT